jgi:hypothetical protein
MLPHLGHLTLGFMTPVKSSSEKNPSKIGHPAKPATKQLKFPKKKKGKYCFQYKSVRGKAGPTGVTCAPGRFLIHPFSFFIILQVHEFILQAIFF